MCYVNSVKIGHRYCAAMLNDPPHCQVVSVGLFLRQKEILKAQKDLGLRDALQSQIVCFF